MEVVTFELGITQYIEVCIAESRSRTTSGHAPNLLSLDHMNAKIACSFSLMVPAVLLQIVFPCSELDFYYWHSRRCNCYPGLLRIENMYHLLASGYF